MVSIIFLLFRITQLFQSTNPEKQLLNSKKRVIKRWNKRNKSCDWYNHKKIPEIKSIADYRLYVPVLNKEMLFASNSFEKLIAGKFSRLKFVMMSSGASTKFSIGALTKAEMKNSALNTDLFLRFMFNAKKGETFIINASSMGVRMFTNHVVSDTGPRVDIVIGLLQTVAKYYKKVFIVGDPIFIKLMVEESIPSGIEWSEINAYFISGGEWLPEPLRKYVHSLTGKSAKNPENGFWIGTYGITEVGYPIMFETHELVTYRSSLSEKLEKNNAPGAMRFTTPFVFNFRATAFYLETLPKANGFKQMVFSPLSSKRLIPVFRYNTEDCGEHITAESIGVKEQKMPLFRFWGRDKNAIEINGISIFVTDIKELLCTDHQLLPAITGYFTLTAKNNEAELVIQLKKNTKSGECNPSKLQQLLKKYYGFLVTLQLVAYNNIPHQMELDFERKFKNII